MATIRHVHFLVVQLLVIPAFKFTVIVFLEGESRPILEEGHDRWVAVCDEIDIIEAKIIWIADLLFRFISTEKPPTTVFFIHRFLSIHQTDRATVYRDRVRGKTPSHSGRKFLDVIFRESKILFHGLPLQRKTIDPIVTIERNLPFKHSGNLADFLGVAQSRFARPFSV